MESEDIASKLSGNIIPLALGILGAVFLIAGLVVVFTSQESEKLEFEASSRSDPSSSPSSKIVVDIAGGVLKPGIYELPAESRIHDVLVASGGFSEDADRDWAAKNLNLAAKLTDGQKLYIYRVGESILESTTASQSIDGLININSASLKELDTLPGIGPVTAQKIVDQRPFISISDLLSKKTVSSSVFEKIKDKITAN